MEAPFLYIAMSVYGPEPSHNLILGKSVLGAPLTKITNESIRTGVIPEAWKESVVVPILKKETQMIKPITDQSAVLFLPPK